MSENSRMMVFKRSLLTYPRRNVLQFTKPNLVKSSGVMNSDNQTYQQKSTIIAC